MEKNSFRIRDIPIKSFMFETNSNDDFGTVLKRYMDEENVSVRNLALRTGISFNSLVKYRSGHIPKDYQIIVMLCIGLKINQKRAEYLFKLAHLSLGDDVTSMIYRMLISLSFVSEITIEECKSILSQYGLQELKTVSNFMRSEK